MSDEREDWEKEIDPDEQGPGVQMSFLDHLEELRWTIMKCLIVFVVLVILIAFFLADITAVLNWPLRSAHARYPDLAAGLVTTSPMAVFAVLLQLCLLGGFLGSLPFCIFFFGQFVTPALTTREKKYVVPSSIGAFLLFIGGSCFGYFLVVPGAVRVAMELNQLLGFELVWSAEKYYGLLVWLVLGLGAIFQFPLIIILMVLMNLVALETFRKWRRLMIVLFFVAAALITPTPDPVTQSMVALPMWALFELALVAAAAVLRARRRELAREAAEEEYDD